MEINMSQLITRLNNHFFSEGGNEFAFDPDMLIQLKMKLSLKRIHKELLMAFWNLELPDPCLKFTRGSVLFLCGLEVLAECLRLNPDIDKYEVLSRYILNQLYVSTDVKKFPEIISPKKGSHI